MTRSLTLLRVVAGIVAIVFIGGLLGWYYFLHGKNVQTIAQNSAAGYGTAAPTFEGTTGSTYANIVSTLGEAPGITATSTTSRLWQVSEVPVAGLGWQKAKTPTLYFVERSSGYVFDAQTQSRSVTRLTDTLRPKVYEASVTQDGSVIERSVDDTGALITFAGTVASSTSASTSAADLTGNDLPTGVTALAVDPVSDTLFYEISGPSNVSIVSTNLQGAKEKVLYSSVIAGWHLMAPGDGTLVLQEAPVDGSEGYAYQIGKTGTASLVAKEPGLTILPRASSTALLYGSSLNGALQLFTQTSANALPTQLSIHTVSDKCAWAPGSALIAYCGVPANIASQQFLNDWYKGLVHTSDAFYEVDASAASSTLLYDPTGDTSAQLDVEEMSVDPTGQYLAFINGRDQSLWILRITQ